jgi:hypothetical protein
MAKTKKSKKSQSKSKKDSKEKQSKKTAAKTSSKATKKDSKAKSKKSKSRAEENKQSEQKQKNKSSQKKTADKASKASKKSQSAPTTIFNAKTLIALGVVALLGLVYIFRGLFVAAMVNGMPISRLKILKQAESAQGENILESLITEQLIFQRAQEQGVQVDEQAVNQEIEKIEQQLSGQGQDFHQLLKLQGMTVEDLKQKLKMQKVIEALLADKINVTEEQVNQYLEDNKDFFSEDQSEEEKKQQAREQLQQQEMSKQYRQWVQKLKDQARIRYFVNYGQQEEPEKTETPEAAQQPQPQAEETTEEAQTEQPEQQ